MPAASVRTIEDLIFYQYAKIIAASAGFSRETDSTSYYGFVVDRMKKLKAGEIKMSSVLTELKQQMISPIDRCVFCGVTDSLSWDHLIPRARGGADNADNHVRACMSCNSSKGKKGIYAWFGLDKATVFL